MRCPTIAGSGRKPLLVAYASVHLGISLLWAGEEILALYVIIRFLSIPPGLAGSLVLVSALANALCDGLVGRGIVRSTRFRRAMPWLSMLAILVASASFAGLPLIATNSLVSAGLLLLLFRLAYSLADVPHNGLTRRLSAGGSDLIAARVRAIGSATATLVISVVAGLIQLTTDNAPYRAAMFLGGVAVAALLLMIPLPLLLRGDGLHIEPSDAGHSAFRSPGVLRFSVATMLGLAGIAATGKALLHIDVVDGAIGPLALLIATVARLGAVWLWSPLARRSGTRRMLGWAYAVSGATALLLPWTRSMGDAVIFLLAWFGLGTGGVAFLSWAVLTETIQQDRQEGAARFTAAFSVYTMATKIALGLAAATVGSWLSISQASVHADPHQFLALGILVLAACSTAGLMIGRRPASNRLAGAA